MRYSVILFPVGAKNKAQGRGKHNLYHTIFRKKGGYHMKGITIDFNNMLRSAVSGGLTEAEITEQREKLPAVHAGVCAKRKMNTWRELPFNQGGIIKDIVEAGKRINESFDSFVVLGIGGSALGSKALFTALKHLKYNELSAERRGGARFYVLDNVDPDAISALFDIIEPEKTCFHVITKSGNTVETVAQFMLALDKLHSVLGDNFKDNVIITTDKEKGNLKRIADEYGFKTYVVPDGTGGRFSVLCPVGLLSAAVLNIDIYKLLEGAADMDKICSAPELEKNPAYMYAMLHCAAMKKGVNINVMMPYAESLMNTAEWYAQLWAESLGKRISNDGEVVYCGQTPVRALGVTDQHSQVQLYTEGPFDKVITFIGVDKYRSEVTIPHSFDDIADVAFLSGHSFNELIKSEQMATEYAVTRSGHMNKTITLPVVNPFTIGELLYFFEIQTAYAGELLNINAFDQPGVEEGKNATYALLGKHGYDEKRRELDSAKPKKAGYIF